jgi:hypothetical protein
MSACIEWAATENTYNHPAGYRQCRTCRAALSARYYRERIAS